MASSEAFLQDVPMLWDTNYPLNPDDSYSLLPDGVNLVGSNSSSLPIVLPEATVLTDDVEHINHFFTLTQFTELAHENSQNGFLSLGVSELGDSLTGFDKDASVLVGEGVSDPVDSDSGNALIADALPAISQAAIAHWQNAGISPDDADLLSHVDFQIADLPSDTLGETIGQSIVLDIDGAGKGWFVDATPQEHSEFSFMLSPHELQADAESTAVGKVDLLTVVAHELGHVMALPHLEDGEANEPLLMDPMLEVGIRRLPTSEEAVFDPAATGPLAIIDDNSNLLTLNGNEIEPTIAWVGGSGFWDDASNWSTGAIPGAEDIVGIEVPEGVTITYRQGDTTVATIVSDGDFVVTGGTLTVTDAAEFNGELTLNNGTVVFDGDVTTNSLTQTNGTLDGNGSITTKTFEWTAGRHDGSGATIVTEQLRI
ncbi:MAG: hypothetical protein ACFBSF_01115, partial [Leptolyngbyaceae cyanobacterium]